MPPNGVFFLTKRQECGILTSKEYPHLAYLMKEAIQSGPLLVHLGKINAQFMPSSQSKFIRSGVGVIDKKTVVFILSEKPVNFYDFARLFKDKFSCQEALYLDGAISEFYLPQLNKYFTKNSFAVMIGVY